MARLLALLLCLVATSALAAVPEEPTSASNMERVIPPTKPVEDRAATHMAMVSQWQRKLLEQQQKDQADYAVVQQKCGEFVAPYEQKKEEAERSLKEIADKLEKAAEVKSKSVLPKDLLAKIAKSKKSTDALNSILDMVTKVKEFGSSQFDAFETLVGEGQDYLKPLIAQRDKYKVDAAPDAESFLELLGLSDLKHSHRLGKKHHARRLRKKADDVEEAESAGDLSTEELEAKVVSSFHSLVDTIQGTSLESVEDATSRAFAEHKPSLLNKLKEHESALKQLGEVKEKIERAQDEAEKRIDWLRDAEAQAKKFAENAEMKYEEVVAVCDAYNSDYTMRHQKRESLLKKADEYIHLTGLLHSRLLPTVQATMETSK